MYALETNGVSLWYNIHICGKALWNNTGVLWKKQTVLVYGITLLCVYAKVLVCLLATEFGICLPEEN